MKNHVAGHGVGRKTMRALACVALVGTLVGAQGTARAADKVQVDLEQAEQALVNLDYDAANKTAARLVQQRGLTHDQLVRSYRVLALTDAVLDKENAARDAFQQLLTFDPEYQGDPNLGPKVQAPFLEARGFMRAQAMKPGVELAVVLRPSEAGTIRVTTRDPTHVGKRAAVGYRWGSEGTFAIIPIGIAEGATADIPPPPAGTTRLDYYAQVFDDHDDVVFESGNANVPKSATVDLSTSRGAGGGAGEPAEPERHSILASPWFWVVAGVVVAGGAVSVYAITHKTTTTTDTLPPTGATLTPSLVCGNGPTCR